MAETVLQHHYKRLARKSPTGEVDPVELAGKWRNPYGRTAPDWYLEKATLAIEDEILKRATR